MHISMRSWAWVVPVTLLLTGSAAADVPNDPCTLANAGDPCTTLDGQSGVCVDSNGVLICEEPSPTTTGSGGGTTTGAGGSTSGGDGGSDSGGGDDGGGCSVSEAHPSEGAGALVFAMGLVWALRRRRR